MGNEKKINYRFITIVVCTAAYSAGIIRSDAADHAVVNRCRIRTDFMRLLKDYDYAGNVTCTTDGLCVKACPLSINTGDNSKYLRSQAITPTTRFIARRLSKNMDGVTAFMRFGLGAVDAAHAILGTRLMDTLVYKAHIVSKSKIPLWNPWMPGRGFRPKDSYLFPKLYQPLDGTGLKGSGPAGS